MKEPEKENGSEHKYSVVLLPSEVVHRGVSIREASAWVETYNAIMQGTGKGAAIVEDKAAA